jgi:RNB domain
VSECFCVLVRIVNGYSQFITSKGYWFQTSTFRLRCGKVEGFASPDEVAPLIPFLPDPASGKMQTEMFLRRVDTAGVIPIGVAAPMVKKLAKLEQDVDAFRRRHASTLDALYEMLADDVDFLEWPLEEVLPKVLGIPLNELSVAGRLALDRFVNQSTQGIYHARSLGTTLGFFVRSRKDMQMQEEVIEWARQYQESAARAALGKDVKQDLRHNPLSDFINKAHRLILRSRKIRSPTTIGLLGPSAESGDATATREVGTGETLTKQDRQIIHFIYQVSEMDPALVAPEAHSICALIFRAIGAYPNLSLGRKVAHLLLQELGVIPPWATRGFNNYSIRLPGSKLFPRYERLVAKAEASCTELSSSNLLTGPTRKDWSQMPVYCIDSKDTIECDDAVSVEPAVSMPDCAWVHVHTANPAAYISPDHPIATAAMQTVESLYTPSNKYAMMPSKFGVNVTSLAANRPVLTISTLLKADGSVVEIELSLGIVHNVVRLTPGAVEAALSRNNHEKATMVIGGARPAPVDDVLESQKAQQALPDLNLLHRFMEGRDRKRLAEWPADQMIPPRMVTPRSKVWTNLQDNHVHLSSDKLSHWKGDPVISVEAGRFPRYDNAPEEKGIVEHAMLLAGESAAKWCKDREIPIIYHAATPHPHFPVSTLLQLSPNDHQILPKARMTTSPEPHWVTKMRQYTKMTSPLRRYPDLVNQWQIQAYLQANSPESQHPKDLDVKVRSSLSALPFTRQKLEDMIKPMNHKIHLIKRATTSIQVNYIHQALFRAFHFKEAKLPEVWDFQVVGPRNSWSKIHVAASGIYGFLLPFRATAELVPSSEQWENIAGRNQYLPVKIETVDAERGLVLVKAVGPASDSQHTTDPLHIQSFKEPVPPGGQDLDQPQCQARSIHS